jgi:hypothetical protein
MTLINFNQICGYLAKCEQIRFVATATLVPIYTYIEIEITVAYSNLKLDINIASYRFKR